MDQSRVDCRLKARRKIPSKRVIRNIEGVPAGN